MKTCPHCGTTNDYQALYCEKCGYTIQSNAEADLYTIAQSQGQKIYEETQSSAPETPQIPPAPPAFYESQGQNAYSYYSPYNTENAYTPSQQALEFQTPYTSVPPIYSYHTTAQGRSVGEIVFSVIAYLFGLGSASFGVAGFTMGLTESDTALALAFLAFLLLGLIVLVPTMILHKKPFIKKWWIRLLIIIGLLVIGFIALIIAAGLSDLTPNPDQALDFYLGGILAVFGLLISLVAVL